MIETSLWIAFWYISSKLKMRSIYMSGPVSELVTHVTGIEQLEELVQLSSLDMLNKSCSPPILSVPLHACLHFSVCRLGDFLAHAAHLIPHLAFPRRSSELAVWFLVFRAACTPSG